MMLDERPNVTSKPKLESGTRLAMRALGIGSIYAVAGVSLVSALIWFGVGAKDVRPQVNILVEPFKSQFIHS